jgi:rRNA (uridine-N3-)-methyltransferase BTM5-like
VGRGTVLQAAGPARGATPPPAPHVARAIQAGRQTAPARPLLATPPQNAVFQRMEAAGKSYLYLGSGDFSRPLAKALKHSAVDQGKVASLGIPLGPGGYPTHAHTLDPGYEIVATELQSREEMLEKQNRDIAHLAVTPLENVYDLQNVGATVIEGFDATAPQPGLAGKKFDRIIFENPHTNDYGDVSDSSYFKDVTCVASNKALLIGIFQNARGHLYPGGKLIITIAGWPFKSDFHRTNDLNKGMQLDQDDNAQYFGAQYGWKLLTIKDQGSKTVRRNNGTTFQANVLKLSYQEAG